METWGVWSLRILAETISLENTNSQKVVQSDGYCSARPCYHMAARDTSTADTRRSMTKTTTIIAIMGSLTLASAITVHAQTPSTSADPSMFVSVSGGGQFQTRTFSESTTF